MSSGSVMASTTQSVFPDAPAGAQAPESHKAMYKVRMRAWRADNAVWLWLWAIGQVIAPIVLLVALPSPVAGIVVAVVFLIAAIVVLAIQWGRAGKEFWQAYATARGLTLDDGRPWISAGVPLLSMGDERKFERVLTGRIGDAQAALGLYTYTVVTYTTDADGDRDRQETDYDFTVVCYRLPEAVAGRYRGVYCREKSFSLGKLQDKLAHDRAVQLESADFNKKYSLRVIDEQDDVALYELFSTTFIDRLTGEISAQWEQVGADLLVFWKNHRTSTAEIDDLCRCAWEVYRRYSEEYQ